MRHFLVLLLFVATVSSSTRADDDSGEAFARIGDVVLTQGMLDAALSRIPEEHRLAFIRDGKKVDQLVKQIMTNMILSGQAREAGYDKEPHVAGRMELAANKALTEAWLDEQVRRMPEPDYEALARENYLLHPDRFMTEPTFDVTHLLIKLDDRTEEEARKLAEDLLAQIADDPESFDRLIAEYSEARNAPANQGRLTGVRPGQTVEAFEEAVSALREPGDFSGLVRTNFGFHIIRLDAKHEARLMSYDEVKDRLIASQKIDYKETARTRVITDAISVAPLEFPDGSVEKMLKRYFGDNLENASDYNQ